MKVKLFHEKTVEENAAYYFDKAKKAKKKIEGAKKALASTIARSKEIRQKDVQVPKVKKARTLRWFEKFRWFVSSEGYLVTGGRDATTNDMIIKKYTKKDDIVFHTDMAGSGFFIINISLEMEGINKGELTEATYEEAAAACASFSRAWKMGLSNLEVFYVNPDQVSKEPNPGEFLPKGAFMIRGKTKYLNPELGVAIGSFDSMMMAGPVSAISKHCKEYVVIKQGKEKASVVAKEIRRKIGGELDDIIRVLPSGGCIIDQS